jgi:hypothetical protein
MDTKQYECRHGVRLRGGGHSPVNIGTSRRVLDGTSFWNFGMGSLSKFSASHVIVLYLILSTATRNSSVVQRCKRASNPLQKHVGKGNAASGREPFFGFLPRKVKGDQVRRALVWCPICRECSCTPSPIGAQHQSFYETTTYGAV